MRQISREYHAEAESSAEKLKVEFPAVDALACSEVENEDVVTLQLIHASGRAALPFKSTLHPRIAEMVFGQRKRGTAEAEEVRGDEEEEKEEEEEEEAKKEEEKEAAAEEASMNGATDVIQEKVIQRETKVKKS